MPGAGLLSLARRYYYYQGGGAKKNFFFRKTAGLVRKRAGELCAISYREGGR